MLGNIFISREGFPLVPPQCTSIVTKGIGVNSSDTLTTLEHEFEQLDLWNKDITYIKMDIEGNELEILPNWIESGILKRVKQIGVEFHNVNSERVESYWNIIEGLYEQGFRLMTYDPNLAVNSVRAEGKISDSFVHTVHEVTFRKNAYTC